MKDYNNLKEIAEIIMQCPFCKKSKCTVIVKNDEFGLSGKYSASVRCNCCFARGPIYTTKYHLNQDEYDNIAFRMETKKETRSSAIKKAITLWNNCYSR